MIRMMYKKYMECSKCHKCMHKDNFAFKDKKNKIYYMYCNKCRQYTDNDDKKYKEKIKYEIIKETNKIKCECGISYVSFREYHTIRHFNSMRHINAMRT